MGEQRFDMPTQNWLDLADAHKIEHSESSRDLNTPGLKTIIHYFTNTLGVASKTSELWFDTPT